MRVCPYCSEPLTLIQRLWGARVFCSREHERLYREEYTRLAVHSLTRSTTHNRKEPPKEAPQPVSDAENKPAAPPALQVFLALPDPEPSPGSHRRSAVSELEGMAWPSPPVVRLPGSPQMPRAGLRMMPKRRLKVSAHAPEAGALMPPQEERASLAPVLRVRAGTLGTTALGRAGCVAVGVYEMVPEMHLAALPAAGWSGTSPSLSVPRTALINALPVPQDAPGMAECLPVTLGAVARGSVVMAEGTSLADLVRTPLPSLELPKLAEEGRVCRPGMAGCSPVTPGAMARGPRTTPAAEWGWCAASSDIAIRRPEMESGSDACALGEAGCSPVASRETPWPAAQREPLGGEDQAVAAWKVEPAVLLARFAPGSGPGPDIPSVRVRRRADGAAVRRGGLLRTPLEIEWLTANLKLADWSEAAEELEPTLAKGSEDGFDVTMRLARPRLVRDVAALEPLGNRMWGLYIPQLPARTLRPRMYAGPPPAYGL